MEFESQANNFPRLATLTQLKQPRLDYMNTKDIKAEDAVTEICRRCGSNGKSFRLLLPSTHSIYYLFSNDIDSNPSTRVTGNVHFK